MTEGIVYDADKDYLYIGRLHQLLKNLITPTTRHFHMEEIVEIDRRLKLLDCIKDIINTDVEREAYYEIIEVLEDD